MCDKQDMLTLIVLDDLILTIYYAFPNGSPSLLISIIFFLIFCFSLSFCHTLFFPVIPFYKCFHFNERNLELFIDNIRCLLCPLQRTCYQYIILRFHQLISTFLGLFYSPLI